MRTKNNFLLVLFFSLLFVLVFVPRNATGQAGEVFCDSAQFAIFETDEPLEMILTFDIRAVRRDVGDERDYHPASLIYFEPSGKQVAMRMRVRTRGHFRRDPQNCNFPPLRLRFRKKERKNTIFELHKKLKLVTHCASKRRKYKQYVIREYLVYKTLNILTEKSLKVRLAEITYIDEQGRYSEMKNFGFLIERKSKMAERIGGETIKPKGLPQDATNYDFMTFLCVFQYFIGNTDWSVPEPHNIFFVSVDEGLPPYAIPYDFDWCGVVNAEYARPSPVLGTESVRERVFRGHKRTEAEYEPIVKLFNEKKAEIYGLYENCPYLSKASKRHIIRYFDDFYATINKAAWLRKIFIQGARPKN